MRYTKFGQSGTGSVALTATCFHDATVSKHHRNKRNKTAAKDAMTEVSRKIKGKGKMDTNNSWWVTELLAADGKKRSSIRNKSMQCKNVRIGV